jgi:tRNA(Arg) A34 adenosine deaminase TadA
MEKQINSLMRAAIQVSKSAREHGNHPFGAILVDEQGQILLEGENTVVTMKDCTGHAETNLMRAASQKFDSDFLARCTLYSSAEPCPMCSAAIFWGNVRNVVFGVSMERMYDLFNDQAEEVLYLSSRSVFEMGRKSVNVAGPVLEDEALRVHEGFWNPPAQ